MSWGKLGKAVGDALIDSVREWTAIIGGLGAGLGAGLLIWQGEVGSVPGIVCLVLAVGRSWPRSSVCVIATSVVGPAR